MTVLAAQRYKNNSDLMLAVKALGYIDDCSFGIDVTYGMGNWWKAWMPDHLYKSDLATGVDFRKLPYNDNYFDFVAFDPPYVAVGGRKTSTIGTFNDAYGLGTVPRTTKELHRLIVDGLHEAHRVLSPKGIVLFKCMNYVSSGQYQTQAYDVLHAVTTGEQRRFTLIDEFIHLRGAGPQPQVNLDGSARRQLHARRNYSHLFILEARK